MNRVCVCVFACVCAVISQRDECILPTCAASTHTHTLHILSHCRLLLRFCVMLRVVARSIRLYGDRVINWSSDDFFFCSFVIIIIAERRFRAHDRLAMSVIRWEYWENYTISVWSIYAHNESVLPNQFMDDVPEKSIACIFYWIRSHGLYLCQGDIFNCL